MKNAPNDSFTPVDGYVAASVRMRDQELELQRLRGLVEDQDAEARLLLLERGCRIAELERALRLATDMLESATGLPQRDRDHLASLKMVANRSRLS